MRVVISVINELNYDQRMQRIAGTLHEQGYAVYLIGVDRKSAVPLTDRPYRQHLMKVWFQKGKLFYLEYNLRLFFKLLFTGADIYYGVDLDTILPSYLVAFLKNKYCVYDAHEIFPELPEVVERPGVQRAWRSLERFIVKRVPNRITVSRAVNGYFFDHYGRAFEVIRNMPLFTAAATTAPAGPPVILYQGALNRGRGLESLLRAMKEVNATLHLCGEGDCSASLRNLADQEGLGERVKFLGRLLPEALHRETRTATIGVNLLEDLGLSYRYSLANKFFDYVAAGKPALHMDFPEYRSLLQEYEVGLLLPDLDPSGIARRLNELLHDPALYERLHRACLQAAVAWCWENEEKKLISFFENLA